MSRWLQLIFGSLIATVIVGGPLLYAEYRHKQQRNFRVVKEGVLYRSGRLSLDGLERVVHDYGIKTVISLREADAPEEKEEAYCRAQEINYYRLPPHYWSAPVGPPPIEPNVRKFREIMDEPANYPVLVRCFAGVHRTGAYCAIYRMEHDGWTNEQAVSELRKCGYSNLDDEWDILGYLEQYRPVCEKRTQSENSTSTRPGLIP